jgi:hypothetical protein
MPNYDPTRADSVTRVIMASHLCGSQMLEHAKYDSIRSTTQDMGDITNTIFSSSEEHKIYFTIEISN